MSWAKSLPENATISISDIGRIPYYTGSTYYDIYGLVNQETALQGFSPEREFMRLPDYFVLVGYIEFYPEELQLKLRLFREQLIVDTERFFSTYKFNRICLSAGADPQDPGYYYLVFPRNNVKFFYDLDFLSFLKGKLDLAEKCALRILEIVPDDIKAYHLLGSIYTEKKNYEKAKKVWEKILMFSPQDSVAIQNLRQLEEQMKE
ncbi:MAG: tetratricopeptide repeat protein [candidate division Zixibacteria bacterium]|nr:tetratricopeptide repeat protein [candidate division Zixibacteria bacterium]